MSFAQGDDLHKRFPRGQLKQLGIQDNLQSERSDRCQCLTCLSSFTLLPRQPNLFLNKEAVCFSSFVCILFQNNIYRNREVMIFFRFTGTFHAKYNRVIDLVGASEEPDPWYPLCIVIAEFSNSYCNYSPYFLKSSCNTDKSKWKAAKSQVMRMYKESAEQNGSVKKGQYSVDFFEKTQKETHTKQWDSTSKKIRTWLGAWKTCINLHDCLSFIVNRSCQIPTPSSLITYGIKKPKIFNGPRKNKYD